MLIFRGLVGIRLFGAFWQLASLWNGRDLATKCSWLAGHTRQALNAWKCHWVLINHKAFLLNPWWTSVVIASGSAKNILESYSWKSAEELPKWIGHDLSASSGIQGQDPIYTPRQGTKKTTREPPFCEQLWIKIFRFMLGILNYQPIVGLGFKVDGWAYCRNALLKGERR